MRGKKLKKKLQQRFYSGVTVLGAHTVDERGKAKDEAVALLLLSGVTVLGAHTVDVRKKPKKKLQQRFLVVLLFWVLIQMMRGKKLKKKLQQRFYSGVTVLGAHTVNER